MVSSKETEEAELSGPAREAGLMRRTGLTGKAGLTREAGATQQVRVREAGEVPEAGEAVETGEALETGEAVKPRETVVAGPQTRPGPKRRGRPRSFDRETALEKALLAFWEHGYEATSVSDLTRVMDIGAPSLYAAFGDKQSLFEEVVRVYGVRYGSFTDRALTEESNARAAVARMLREAASEYTDPAHPHGCLVVHAATNCSTPEVEESLRVRRNANIAAIRSRIEADIATGALPAHVDAAALARHAGAMIQGMSQQARDGASREELEALAEIAMANWPRT